MKSMAKIGLIQSFKALIDSDVVLTNGFYNDLITKHNIAWIMDIKKVMDNDNVVNELSVYYSGLNELVKPIELETLVSQIQEKRVCGINTAITFLALAIQKGFIEFDSKIIKAKNKKHVLSVTIRKNIKTN